MPRRRNMDGDIEDKIIELALSRWSAAQIRRQLQDIFPDRELPSDRTLQRMVSAPPLRMPQAVGGVWSITDAATEDIPLILDALREVALRTQGKKHTFSQREARLILKIRRAAPDLPAWKSWLLALQYIAREGRDEAALDAYLVFSPWKGAETLEAYKQAVKDGVVPRLPEMWTQLVEETSPFKEVSTYVPLPKGSGTVPRESSEIVPPGVIEEIE